MLLASSVVLIGEGAEGLAKKAFRYINLPGGSKHREALLWTIAIIASSLGGSLVLSRIITRPLSKLHLMATKVAEGNLACRLDEALVLRGDEIGSLAGSFNLMTNNLVKLLDNERRLIRDISHDLRSPLGRIKMALAVIDQKTRLGAPEIPKAYLAQVERDVERMEEMLTQMLDEVRLENTMRTGLGRTQINLENLVRASVDDFRFKANEENKSITVDSAGDLPFYGNGLILKQGFDNILKNALNYTPAGGTVRIKLKKNASEITLEVEDSGPGVSNDLLEDIFKPFVRADESRQVGHGGFGLGLSIAQRAAQIHEGRAGAANIIDETGKHLGFKVFMILPTGRI